MSKIRWTEEDLYLFTKVLIARAFWLFLILTVSVVALLLFLAGFDLRVLLWAFFVLVVWTVALHTTTLRKVRKIWRAQSPDGVLDVELSKEGLKVITASAKSESKWSMFTKRLEMFGCYALKAAGGLYLIYRKDYFTDKERRIIEENVPKARSWLVF